jgi:hypothetical protein
MAGYVYVVQMDIPPEHDAEFNRIYDTDHLPIVLKVPGVRGCQRFKLEHVNPAGGPRYMAFYEIDSPDVVESAAWKKAVDEGEWKPKIRPHTFNRIISVFRKLP